MTPEFSVPVAVAELSPAGTERRGQADAQACAKLAERLGLQSLERFAFTARLTPEQGGSALSADGTVQAVVVQACSVTLEPITTEIEQPFFLRFEAESEVPGTDAPQDLDMDMEEDDPPEPIIDGIIDLGETLVQLVAVEIDPFPRKPGLPFEDYNSGPAESEEEATADEDNPFAVLETLKDKLEKPR